MKNLFTVCCCIILCLPLLSVEGRAQGTSGPGSGSAVSGEIPSPPVPRQFHYQGCLTNPSGVKYTGTYTVKFEVIDLDSSPPVVLFAETVSALTVNDGIFEHAIGSVDTTTEHKLNPLIFQKRAGLRLTVDGEVLLPPIPLYPAPIAMVALYADSLKQPLPPGPPGPAGPPGLNGANGTDGIDGINGVNGINGIDGINCWDLNGNGKKDAAEDINKDGVWDAKDCKGPKGDPGGSVKDTILKLTVDTLIVLGESDHFGWEHYRDGISVGGDKPTSRSTTITKDGINTRQIGIVNGTEWNALIDSTGEGYFRSLHIFKGDPLDPSNRENIISFDSTGSVHNRPETYIDPDIGDTTIIRGGQIDPTTIRIIPQGGHTPTAVIAPDGEGYFRSLHVVDSLGNPLISFNRDGTSDHSGTEYYWGGIEIWLDNGNILRLDPIEGLTIKDPTGGWVSHINPWGDFLFIGKKNNIVRTENYGTRKLYAMESPEIRYADYGQGRLSGGEATIRLDPMFLETVTIDDQHPMIVTITPTAQCNGLYVAQKSATSFVVRELISGTSNASFDWQIVVKRKGYEDVRMEPSERAATREDLEKQSRQMPARHDERFRTKAPSFDRGNRGQR